MLWLLLLPAAAPPHAVYVDVILPQPITFREELTWTGTLRGRLGPTPLVAPVAGRVVELLPNADPTGRRPYRKGDVLLRIDDRAARFAVERAQIGRDRARAQRELAELEVQLARAGKGTRLEIARAEKRVTLARADESLAELTLREAEHHLDQHIVRAPADGWPEGWKVAEEEVVKPHQGLGSFHCQSTPEVEFTVSDGAYQKIIRPLRERRSPLNRAELTVIVTCFGDLLGPATLCGYARTGKNWTVLARLHQPVPQLHAPQIEVWFRDTWEHQAQAIPHYEPPLALTYWNEYSAIKEGKHIESRRMEWHLGLRGQPYPGVLGTPLRAREYLILRSERVHYPMIGDRPPPIIPLIVPGEPIDPPPLR